MLMSMSKESTMRLCPRCKVRELHYDPPLHEDDDGGYQVICDHCADREYEAHMERREFEHYHPKED